MRVKGTGSVKIKKFVDGKWHDSIITDVLDLKKNLFSEGILTKKRMTIIKNDEYVRVYDKEELVAADQTIYIECFELYRITKRILSTII